MTTAPIDLADAKENKLFYVVANTVVYRKSDKRCLILKRHEREKVHPGKWALPGGKLEWADVENAKQDRHEGTVVGTTNILGNLARREAKEESGVDIADGLKYLYSYAFVRPDGVPVVGIKFAGLYEGGEVSLEEDAFSDYAWVTKEESNNYDCLGSVLKDIEQTVDIYSK